MAIRKSSSTVGESFTVITSTGGTKTATLTRTFPAGTYLIESKAMDTNLEIYLGASDGTQVGTSAAGAKSITASAAFLYVTTINADVNDAITFTLKSAATLVTKTDAVWSPPTITDITPSGLTNIDSSTTITGTNFATNVDVKFRKSDDSTLVTPKSTVRGSATSIIATRPDSFAPGDAPYDVIVTNPSTNLSATSLNAITAGAVPVWVTSTTLNSAVIDTAFSQTISATDADGGSSITYGIVSGSFPTGLSLNTSTGEITGTPTGSTGTYTITISATDSGANTVNRTFTQLLNSPIAVVEYIIIGGGGGGAGKSGGNWEGAGGGGAGGYRSSVTGENSGGGLSAEQPLTITPGTTLNVVVGAGGNGFEGTGVYRFNGTTGYATGSPSYIYSNLTGTILSVGGGSGASDGSNGRRGGSGGGGGGSNGIGGTAIYGQGYAGATAAASNQSGGGGGAGSAGTSATGGGSGGNGIASLITGSSITRAGGGGGGAYSTGSGGSGGSGGGGAGKKDATGDNGTVNTGGGGGGVGGQIASSYSGGNGGSGVVILRSNKVAASTTGSPTYTTSGSYHIYQFNGDGSITL